MMYNQNNQNMQNPNMQGISDPNMQGSKNAQPPQRYQVPNAAPVMQNQQPNMGSLSMADPRAPFARSNNTSMQNNQKKRASTTKLSSPSKQFWRLRRLRRLLILINFNTGVIC